MKQDLKTTGQAYDFTLLLKDKDDTLIPINTTIHHSEMETLITSFEKEIKKVSVDTVDNTHSSQSGTFSFSTPDNRSLYGIHMKIITQDNGFSELYAIKEATDTFTFLREYLSFYVVTWIVVLFQ